MLHSWWLLLALLLVAADETGKCLSDLDEPVFGAQDAASCWLNCVGEYGSQIVAIDFYDDDDTCYCQNDCKCVEESDGTLLVSDGLSTIERCDRVETALFSYLFFDDFFYEDDFIPSFEEYELSKTGWCFSSLDKFIGSFRNVDDCWYECNIEYDSIVAIDWYEDDGSCYCQDDCECMRATDDDGILLIAEDYDLPGKCFRPTYEPTRTPTRRPTSKPSRKPSQPPTYSPTLKPIERPTPSPTYAPTLQTTDKPTRYPSEKPTRKPTRRPSKPPTTHPTLSPSRRPTTTRSSYRPTRQPTQRPSRRPTTHPSPSPLRQPTTLMPSYRPTRKPTQRPSGRPTTRPSISPSRRPTTTQPAFRPTNNYFGEATQRPTREPTRLDDVPDDPTARPTPRPTSHPEISPTPRPSAAPSLRKTTSPTRIPTRSPIKIFPTTHPETEAPTRTPAIQLSFQPTPACLDSANWYKAGSPAKSCSWVGELEDGRRCDAKGEDGSLAHQACFQSCGCPSEHPSFEPSVYRASVEPTSRMRTFEPSTLPTTRKPSSEYPTSRPTVTKKVLISSSLVLAGIRPSDVSDDDTELLKEVLVDSIESLIETSQISVSALESYSATRRRSLLSGGDRVRVDIDVLVVEGNFFDELKKAVVDGSLDEAMSQSESKALSSSSVDKEESIRLITEHLSYESEAPTPAEDGKGGGGKDGFSSSTNFAIAVGASVAGLILLALPAGAFLCKRQRDIKPLVQSSRTLIGDREADDSIHIQLDVADEQEQESAKAKRGSSPRKFTSMRSRSYQVRATARKFLFEDGRILWRTSADPGVPDSLVRQLEEDGSVDLVKSRSGIKDFCVDNAKLREDLERAPALNLNDRMQALRCHLGTLRVKWTVGRVQFTVSRSNLAGNAFETIGNLAVDRWRQPFFITFKDEAGLDAGGVSREFFRLLMDELFDVKYGLFKYGAGYTYQLADDAESLVAFDGDAEARDARYTFVGRLLGKALLEGHMISAHPTIPLLKHIACEPVGLADLQLLDYLYWRNLNELATMDSDLLASLELTFSVVTETFGQHVEQELIPGGKDVAVTSSNVKQLLELRLKQRVCDVHKNGLAAFLRGIYDVSIFCLLSEAGRYIERRTQVVPAEMLMLLSARELELVLCGVPEIRVDEWRASCQYGGEFKSEKEAHRVVAYFWKILETWENEKKAQLLQWCTGTAALPVQGFEYLQGRDGVIRKFALTSVSLDQAIYPRAHTCFNRIDLPLYKTKRDLEEALDFVLLNSASQTFSMD